MKPRVLSFILLIAIGVVAQDQRPVDSDKAAAPASNDSAIISPKSGSQGERTCYALRTYFFEPSDGGVRFGGTETCQPADRFRAMYIPAQPMNGRYVTQIRQQFQPPSRDIPELKPEIAKDPELAKR